MLPLIAAAAASKGNGQGGDGMSNSIKYLLVAIGVALVGFFGWRAYKTYQDKKKATENNNLDTKGVTAQMVVDYNNKVKNAKALSSSQLDAFNKTYGKMFAAQLRNAFNPSGYKWLISTDGTTNPEVMSIADKMKQLGVPFKYVAGAYYEAYEDDLNLRLQKELNTKELKEFYKKSGLQGLGEASLAYRHLPISGLIRIS